MGYFGKQIYNEPMSMYVDPRLDIIGNALGAVQKRHDENYAQMSALDLMAHNTKVAEGDRGIKDAALGQLKAQRDAIAASGDYAYAMPKIGAAVRDWSGNEDMIAAKDNKVRIDEAEKTRQAMRAAGHLDLDFNPADNWSTIDPVTKQRRTFTSGIEKKLDWDARAQDVSKLLANTENIGLTAANVRDYLQHGSITGITDARVKANLENAINRFMVSNEGDQMKRKLTKIDGMSDAEANGAISDYLMSVGRAQVHRKEDINYQVNSAALQRDQMAQQERHWQAEFDAKKANDEAELALKRAKATGKTNAAGEEVAPNPYLQMVAPSNTTVSPDAFEGILPAGTQPGTYSVPLTGQIVNYGKLPGYTPEDEKFMSNFTMYREALGDADMDIEGAKKARYKLETEVEGLQKSLKDGKVYFPNQSMSTTSNPKGWTTGANLTPADKALKAKQLEEATQRLVKVKAIEENSKRDNIDLSDSKKFSKLRDDKAEVIGKVINLGGYGDFRISTNADNKRNVGNDMHIEGEVLISEKDLNQRMSQLGYGNEKDWTGSPTVDEWQETFLKESGGNGMITPSHIDKDGNQIYSIPIKNKMAVSPSLMNKYNKNVLPDKVFGENLNAHTRQLEMFTVAPQVANKINRMKDETAKKNAIAEYQGAVQNNDVEHLMQMLQAKEEQFK